MLLLWTSIFHCHSPGVATVARRLRYSYSRLRLILVVVSTVATPGEWQCKIRTGGVRRLAVANGSKIVQMLLVIRPILPFCLLLTAEYSIQITSILNYLGCLHSVHCITVLQKNKTVSVPAFCHDYMIYVITIKLDLRFVHALRHNKIVALLKWLQESLALASMARDDPPASSTAPAMRGKVVSEFET